MPIAIRVSCCSLFGEEESGAFIFIAFYLLRRTPPPIPLHPSESEVVYDGFRSDQRQDPTDMQKAIPSL